MLCRQPPQMLGSNLTVRHPFVPPIMTHLFA
jgi:hypothetical protein